MAAVVFDGVWKRYGPVEAVRDLQLACPQGEMLALLGPSGCGKSSTLKMVAGVEELSEGEIFFDDRPVSQLGPGARNIAMVFEDYALYPHLSARDNIAFPLRVRGTAKAAAARRVDEVVALLGLEELGQQRVRDLSGGAQQRISIGRALVRNPELILFDEPLSHLDGDQKVRLRAEIKRLQRTADLTSILVTHDQSEAIAMADRVAVMNDGVLQQVGTPAELYDSPANLFVANFIGEPPMNLLRARVEQRDGSSIVAGEGWLSELDRQSAVALGALAGAHALEVGIRPEHLVVLPRDGTGARRIEGRPVPAEVRYLEPRGDSDVLTLALAEGGLRLTAEVEGPTGWRSGDAVSVILPARSLHLFDAESGRNLRRRS
ncbi:sn-glycerol 3-phosphate transport system ATP-binding protein/multiple sugar transport system ATP-binding protein [Tistlia consotensis]|uniref:sn-glycerol 3-phosphate transport system ATP-binding protein/multiple sugar transport system ATP-binding protein n=1 Tax=Tistlia consotensis USBA 355 TaxID=560819 RepID=A0A1Y6C0P5_9PROT|nr:ABC transporter ATP-binding protein [Tistlia consotensis]SMF37422.1 sn-glycerol 3-phosphate transport system ATP-binding protein/multiple sugar transport system ATP-binding protein [Tistlia consotensis USBA 355]SNR72781.1 sn-glycerol 3-phosphate transport system ATP-binding protein/multiple sugar transport system ATP-binding protein [Tistlia consotensis]